MGKMITAKRKDNEGEQAQLYIKTHILFPAGLMGLLAMVIGIVALVYQLIIETYDEWTFAKSSLLLVVGILFGWGQTRYHRAILRTHPEFFASRMKSSASGACKKFAPSGRWHSLWLGTDTIPSSYPSHPSRVFCLQDEIIGCPERDTREKTTG